MSNLPQLAAEIEQVLISGDLARLSPEKRVSYYNSVCQSLKLNPLTKPFDYINLNGRITLYTKKDATDQLRRQWDVSIRITNREKLGDVYVVTAQAQLLDRVDEAVGAVPIAGLRGANLANALMKAETKAKRRVTLSICGLGMTDETELETIKNVNVQSYGQELVSMQDLLEKPVVSEGEVETESAPEAEPEEVVDDEPEKVVREVEHQENPDENVVEVKKFDPMEAQPEEEGPFDTLPDEDEGAEESSLFNDLPDDPEKAEKKKLPNAAEVIKVTEAQVRRMLAISRAQGWKDKQTYELIKKMCGHEQLRNMNITEYNFIVQFVNDNKPDVLETL